MQDNSFGKNTEQELHDLSIEPSEKVWLGVEKELNKKKRRYLIGWWWLLPLLIGGVALLWQLQRRSPSAEKEILTKNETNIPVKKSSQVAEPIAKDSLVSNENSIMGLPADNSAGSDAGNNSSSFKRSSQRSRTTIAIHPPVTDEDYLYELSLIEGKTTGKTKAKIVPSVSETDELRDTVNKTASVEEPTSSVLTTDTDNATNTLATVEEKQKEIIKTDIADSTVPAAKVEEQQKKNGWQKEWLLAAGATSLGSFDFSRSESLYQYADPGSIPTSPGSYRKYTFDRGIYLQVGFNIGRKLSPKVSWFTGLHYNQQSIKARLQKDSAALYSVRTKWNVTSHNLVIPLLLKFSLNNKIDINTGMLNTFVISSNWNKYETILSKQKKYAPVFYLSPSFRFNKFSIGPLLNADLNQYRNQQHLFNYGLQLKYFPKK